MSNKNQGDVTKVLVGPVKLMVAPKGTALPTLTDNPVVWGAGWRNPGYTEDGLSLSISPSVVEINVDEESDPVDEVLDKTKTSISVKLSQATLDNLQLAIPGTSLTTQAADATHIGTRTLSAGGSTIDEVMVGFEGVSAEDKTMWRVFLATRAKVKANVQMAFKRSGKHIIPVEFSILADSATGVPFKIVEMTADKTA